jgi:hypothetical protein
MSNREVDRNQDIPLFLDKEGERGKIGGNIGEKL